MTKNNSRFYDELTQREKFRRHYIFRCLITLLRGDRFTKNGDYASIVSDSLELDRSKIFGRFDADTLWGLGVCRVPNAILNALVCGKLAATFGDLSVCGCFYQIEGWWRLDVDDKYAGKGLLLPVYARATRLIYAMSVYRHPDDERPFILKLRK